MKNKTIGDLPQKTTLLSTIEVEKPQITHDQLWLALRDVEDLFERTLTPLILVGKTGESVRKDKQLEGEFIEAAIRRKQLTETTLEMFFTLRPKLMEFKDSLSYKVGDVSVIIKIIEHEYDMFNYPDKVYYLAGEYLVPNPWSTYEQEKEFIK
jgi:hypothetical protein